MNNKSIKIGLIVEADFEIGMGHVSRCVDIYNEFKIQNFECEFIIPNNLNLIKWLSDRKIQFRTFNVENWKSLNRSDIKKSNLLDDFNILFVDLIEKSFSNFDFLYDFKKTLIVSITLLYFPEDIRYEDISFFPDIESKSKDYINTTNKKIRLYSGNDYFTFRDEFNGKKCKIKNHSTANLMITMGGSDPFGITDIVYSHLKKLTINFQCSIILGDANDKTEKDFPDERFKVLRSVSNISELMINSDLVFINGGLTRYELAVLGVPFIAVSINEIQYDINQRFLKLIDQSLNVGIYNQINSDQFKNTITSLVLDINRRKVISDKLLSLIDTNGASRIVDIAISNYYKLKNK